MNRENAMPIKPIEVGKTVKFRCEPCLTEFEVKHEPDYDYPGGAEAFGGESKAVASCPFCGEPDPENLDA